MTNFRPKLLGLEKRSMAQEFMDDLEFQGDELVESFRFIRLVNLLGGGQRAVINGLRHALHVCELPKGKPVEVLDLGCGIGDLGIAMTTWGARRGLDIRYRGLDQSAHTLDLARRHTEGRGFEFVQGDLFSESLPEADFIVASMVLHHFSDADVIRALRQMSLKARQAVIINDLERSAIPWVLAWFLTIPFSLVSRADALLSVEKGFQAAELRSLCDQAGLRGMIRRAIGWRLLAVLTPAASRSR